MKYTKEQLLKAKNELEWRELCRGGLRKINGGYTTVTNLKIYKDKVVYDITYGEQDMGDGYSRKEKIKGVEIKMTQTNIQNLII